MAKKRIFVRGLPKETTEESLISRFESFGAVSDVSIARDGFVEKGCRGFGHLTIDIDDGSWKKCMSLLNGSKWKGQTIHISEARPSHTERTANIAVDIPTEKPLRRLVRHAADMTLVNDNDSKIRKGWRRSQFGRLIAVVKIRKPNGELVVMDPSHHKDALTRIYTGTRQKPIDKLTWFYDGKSVEPSTTDIEYSHSESENDEDQPTDEKFDDPSLLEKPTKSIEESYAPAEFKQQGWEEVSGGQAFSLAACLNLPKVEVDVNLPKATILQHAKELDMPTPVDFDLKNIFFDFTSVFNAASDLNHLFIPKGSRLESLTVWKGSRSEIRKDFKKQSKEAKRLIRKKSNHIRNINIK